MALKLQGVDVTGKTDVYKFNPLQLVKRFAKFTGRKQRTPEAIEAMIQSLLVMGQEVAFTYRKGFDNGPIPVTGHTRILAAAAISERGLTSPKTGITYSVKEPFLLRGEYREMNEVEAMFHTFTENDPASRTALNDVDVAYFIQVVSETTGLTDSAIAEKLGKPASWVSQHREVLTLDFATQQKLITGELKFGAVSTVAGINPDDREKVLAQAKADNKGKLTTPAIVKAARKLKADTANKPLKRTDADWKQYLEGQLTTRVPSAFSRYLFGIQDFRNGVIDEIELNALGDALEAAVEVAASAAA